MMTKQFLSLKSLDRIGVLRSFLALFTRRKHWICVWFENLSYYFKCWYRNKSIVNLNLLDHVDYYFAPIWIPHKKYRKHNTDETFIQWFFIQIRFPKIYLMRSRVLSSFPSEFKTNFLCRKFLYIEKNTSDCLCCVASHLICLATFFWLETDEGTKSFSSVFFVESL